LVSVEKGVRAVENRLPRAGCSAVTTTRERGGTKDQEKDASEPAMPSHRNLPALLSNAVALNLRADPPPFYADPQRAGLKRLLDCRADAYS
jgi:hypothetical protein